LPDNSSGSDWRLSEGRDDHDHLLIAVAVKVFAEIQIAYDPTARFGRPTQGESEDVGAGLASDPSQFMGINGI
jgi:hypothetical protein